MQNEVSQDELAQLFRMLQQITECSSTSMLEVDSYKGHTLAIAILLNSLTWKHSLESASPLFTSAHLTVENDTIKTFASTSHYFLDYCATSIVGRSFKRLLAAASRRYIPLLEKQMASGLPHYAVLYIIDSSFTVVPTICCLKGTCITLIYLKREPASIAVQKQYSDILVEVAGSYSRSVQLLEDVYQYIVTHPEDRMPSNIQIARMFYSNRQKLKELFRHLLGTSIYQLYNTTRLEKAHQLISNTNLPLLDIASICGFNNYQHFSSLFKKHFGYRPGTLVRQITKARE